MCCSIPYSDSIFKYENSLLFPFTKKNLQVCYLCNATKGENNDVHMSYTDVSNGAPYWQSLYHVTPWVVPPPYSFLHGFEISMCVPDLLHVFNLGIGQHACGSTLKIMLSERHIFTSSTLEERMKEATESLRQFAAQKGLHLRFKKLSKSRLRWDTKKYPELTGSGYDTFIVMDWLDGILSEHAETYPEIATLIWSGNRALKLLYRANRFLTEEEKQSLRFLGNLFATTYVKLAHSAIAQCKLLWRCVPKLHLFVHICSCKRHSNPVYSATWMDEDFLKKTGHTLSLTSNRTAQYRFLQRWLLGIPFFLQSVSQP